MYATITSRGTSYEPIRDLFAASAGTSIKTFQIAAINDNDLTCVEWDGETPGTNEFKIAKPWTLRRYVYESTTGSTTYTYVNSQRRTAVEGSITETQDITKRYVVLEMVVAVNLTTIRPASTGLRETWEWLDLNMDGRDWARAAE